MAVSIFYLASIYNGRSISVPLQYLFQIISFLEYWRTLFLTIIPFPSILKKLSFSAETFQVIYKHQTSSKLYPFQATAPFVTSPFSPATPIGTSFPPLHWNGSSRLPSVYPLTNPMIRSILLFTLTLFSASCDVFNLCLLTLPMLCFHGVIHTIWVSLMSPDSIFSVLWLCILSWSLNVGGSPSLSPHPFPFAPLPTSNVI